MLKGFCIVAAHSLQSRDAFCLFYDAKTKTVQALNGSGHSPEKLTIDHVRKQGITGSKIPLTNLNSVTVPGESIHCVAL
jgi:gamma-glutamyltranspeptidase